MNQSLASAGPPSTTVPSERTARATSAATTKILLVCGAVAAPIFLLSSLLQALIRPGFDITRHPISLLSLGDQGWMQILTFLIAGPLAITGAVGMRRAMRGVSGGRWAPILMAIFGLGLISAGIFRTDPARGFPPGTPSDLNSISSLHGILHQVSGSVSFLALIVACFVLARYFAVSGRGRSSVCSVIAGVIFIAGLANGPGPAGSLTLFVGVAVAWLWVALTEVRLARQLPPIR